MHVAELLGSLGGVARTSTLLNLGATPRELTVAVAAGAVVKVRQGVFAHPMADPVRVAEVAWNGVATCVTAAVRMSLPVLGNDARLHLRVEARRSQSGRNASMPRHVVRHVGAGVPKSLLAIDMIDDASQCLERGAQLALIDAALNRGMIVDGDLIALTRGSTRRRAWLRRHADGRAQSPLETLARFALIRAQLPFEVQVEIPTVGRVDLVVAGRIILEADGFTYHGGPVAFAADRRRDRAAAALGYTTLRFTAAEVADPNLVVRAVRAALAAPSRPPSERGLGAA